jgi:ComF family protein
VKLVPSIRHLIDFCYPRVCAVCDTVGAGRLEMCDPCFQKLRELEDAPACPRCAMPLATSGAPCPYCQSAGVRPFERIVALGPFRDPVRHLIHQVKYHNRWPLAEFLADRLIEQESAKALLTETDVLVPVPLHPWRQMSRGYNQAELVARRLGKRCRIKLSSALVRLKNTETQTHLHSKEKRLENLRDAFGLLRPGSVHARHVVIVDDVMTTGATLGSAARAILDAEPESLSAIVVAVADPRGQDFQAI